MLAFLALSRRSHKTHRDTRHFLDEYIILVRDGVEMRSGDDAVEPQNMLLNCGLILDSGACRRTELGGRGGLVTGGGPCRRKSLAPGESIQ